MKRINKQTLPCTVPGCGKLQKVHGWCAMHNRRMEVYGDLDKGMPAKKIGVIGCEIEGCGKPYFAKGWCRIHYTRWRSHGTPLAEVAVHGAAIEYLEKIVLLHRGSDCLRWPFACNEAGYAVINNPNGSNLVPRIVCERIRGAPPAANHEARHLCGKGHEGCCSPEHLVWGTPHENQMDRVAHGTHIRGERHPLHKLTEPEARKILSLKGDVSQYSLAKRYGVSRSNISHVQNRTTWAWL